MNEDITDEICNDEAGNITTQVDLPLEYGRAIVCKTTLVANPKRLIHKIAVALRNGLINDVKELNVKENDVFVIVMEPMEKVREANVKRLQKALHGMIEKDLNADGFIEIQVYRDVDIYKEDGHVEATECIYNNAISHEKPLNDDFVDILTRVYEPTLTKPTIDFPHLIF